MNYRLSNFKTLLIAFMAFITISITAVSAYADCSAHKFDIESELTGLIIGDISTRFVINGVPGKNICLSGTFEGKPYRYEYRCNGETLDWDFIRKIKEEEIGQSCFWGKIR